MSNIFSSDNIVWKIMDRVADAFLLTLIWLLCSLPVITIGASMTALYHVTLQMAEKRDGYLIKTFLKAFRDNFLRSVGVWGGMMIIGGVIGSGIVFSLKTGTDMGKTMQIFFLIMGVLYSFFFTVLFPLLARLDTGIANLFLMTFMVCVKKFSWVLLMTVLTGCIIAVGVLVMWPVLLFSAGGIAYLNSLILVHEIFPEYGWVKKDH